MVKLFTDKIKMTPQEIFEYKVSWKSNSFLFKVHSDLEAQCKDWCRKNLNRWEWDVVTHSDVYAHTFYFEHGSDAKDFGEKFKDWIV